MSTDGMKTKLALAVLHITDLMAVSGVRIFVEGSPHGITIHTVLFLVGSLLRMMVQVGLLIDFSALVNVLLLPRPHSANTHDTYQYQ